MNRNALKIIALLSMITDHVGLYFFDNNIVCRIIGRLAFPIFAFFIAEGLKKTHNIKKYVLTLTIFAIISQIPYVLLGNVFKLNILFTFLLSIGMIKVIETIFFQFKQNKKIDSLFTSIFLLLLIIVTTILGYIGVIDYGIFGITFIVCLYFISSKLKLTIAMFVLILLSLENAIISGFTIFGTIQFWSILSIPLLLLYNNKKGNLRLKYLFYYFYPTHLALIWVIVIMM